MKPSRRRDGFRLLLAALACAAGCLSGCRPAPAPNGRPAERLDPAAVEGERALEEVAALVALGLRDSGTPGAAAAAAHIRDRLRAIGVEVDIEEFEDDTPLGPMVFRNVIGRLPGRGEGLILLGSHFDTKRGMPEGFQGANDSGSSTGLLIELARVLKAGPKLGPEIRFAFFDGEECIVAYGPRDGLHGSRRMARQLVDRQRARDVLAVLVLDMIGDRDLTVMIPRNTHPDLARALFAAAAEEGERDRFRLAPTAILDDHVPFLQAGMPAALLIDFEYGSGPGRNDYWHTAEDTMDKLRAESLALVGRVTIRFLNGRLR